MQEPNVNENAVSYADMLRETQQAEFPLLGEVTEGIVDDPLTLMNAQTDDDGVVVPCALPEVDVKAMTAFFGKYTVDWKKTDANTIVIEKVEKNGR